MNNKETDSTSIPPYIPEDLIIQILVKLPVKSLVRFKTVCKRWKSLITNPKFAKPQLQYPNQYHLLSVHLILTKYSTYALYIDLNDYLHNTPTNKELLLIKPKLVKLSCKPLQILQLFRRDYSMIGSCNGIICYRFSKGNELSLCLWNPISDETRMISLPSRKDGKSDSNVLFSAFGYAPSIDDYKIVLVDAGRRSVMVYSLRRDNWNEYDRYFKRIEDSFLWSSARFEREDVVFNDALYFIMGNIDPTNKNKGEYVVRFDMVKEVFRKVTYLPKVQWYRGTGSWDEAKIAVTEDNKICYYQAYTEITGFFDPQVKKRQGVEVFEMLDGAGLHGLSWKEKYAYKGSWEDGEVKRELKRILSHGKVLLFEERTPPFMLGRLDILDISHDNPSFIPVNNEYIDEDSLLLESHYGNIQAESMSYVPSLISPYCF